MNWYNYVACFFAGAFLANVVPHLSRLWRDLRSALAIVKPEAVIAWHRGGFRLLWIGRCGTAHPDDRSFRARSEI